MKERLHLIGLDVDQISFDECLNSVMRWGLARENGFVCFANVHMSIEAWNDRAFSNELRKARLVLADGKPIAGSFRWIFGKKQERIAGMDFMPALLSRAHEQQARIFLYGSTESVLAALKTQIATQYPGAVVAGSLSPPFRLLSAQEIQAHLQIIQQASPHFVFVALGCPKQERWMAAHFLSLEAILFGFGGAFPVVAGMQKRSPRWMRDAGLEWLYRLQQEPRRLLKRYLYTNICYIFLLTREVLSRRLGGKQ